MRLLLCRGAILATASAGVEYLLKKVLNRSIDCYQYFGGQLGAHGLVTNRSQGAGVLAMLFVLQSQMGLACAASRQGLGTNIFRLETHGQGMFRSCAGKAALKDSNISNLNTPDRLDWG